MSQAGTGERTTCHDMHCVDNNQATRMYCLLAVPTLHLTQNPCNILPMSAQQQARVRTRPHQHTCCFGASGLVDTPISHRAVCLYVPLMHPKPPPYCRSLKAHSMQGSQELWANVVDSLLCSTSPSQPARYHVLPCSCQPSAQAPPGGQAVRTHMLGHPGRVIGCWSPDLDRRLPAACYAPPGRPLRPGRWPEWKFRRSVRAGGAQESCH